MRAVPPAPSSILLWSHGLSRIPLSCYTCRHRPPPRLSQVPLCVPSKRLLGRHVGATCCPSRALLGQPGQAGAGAAGPQREETEIMAFGKDLGIPFLRGTGLGAPLPLTFLVSAFETE